METSTIIAFPSSKHTEVHLPFSFKWVPQPLKIHVFLSMGKIFSSKQSWTVLVRGDKRYWLLSVIGTTLVAAAASAATATTTTANLYCDKVSQAWGFLHWIYLNITEQLLCIRCYAKYWLLFTQTLLLNFCQNRPIHRHQFLVERAFVSAV